jgi:hypothetical protein
MVNQLVAAVICGIVGFRVVSAAVYDVDLTMFGPGPTTGWLGYGCDVDCYLGRTFKPGGDFNGDGLSDALIGGPGQHVGGAVHIVFGSRSFSYFIADTADPTRPCMLPPGTGLTIYSTFSGDACGEYLDGGADFNGDGFDDVAIGCPGASENAGTVTIVFGHRPPYFDVTVGAIPTLGRGFVIYGSGWYAHLGRVAFADVNGDGFADVIAAETFYDNRLYGNVYVLLGKRDDTYYTYNVVANSTFDGVAGFKLKRPVCDDRFGYSVSSVGDHNGDGYEDFAVQATYVDYNGRNDTGALYVIFGHSSATPFDTNIDLHTIPTATLDGFRVYGPADQGQIAASSSPGDINGDGISDLVINTNYTAGRNTGSTYVLFGHTGAFSHIDLVTYTFTSSTGYRIVGANDYNTAMGNFVGDVNNDGYDDIIVSSGREPGQGYVVYTTPYVLFSHGPETPYSDISLDAFVTGSSTGYKISGQYSSDGWVLTGKVGDINGDGADDVGFALPAASTPAPPAGNYRAGKAWLLLSASAAPTAGPTARPTAVPTIISTMTTRGQLDVVQVRLYLPLSCSLVLTIALLFLLGLQRLWGVSYADYSKALGQCRDDLLYTITHCLSEGFPEIYRFTVTGGSDGGRMPSRSVRGGSLRAPASRGSEYAQEASPRGPGQVEAPLSLEDGVAAPAGTLVKAALSEDDYLVISYAVVPPSAGGPDYGLTLQGYADALVANVNSGAFDEMLQRQGWDNLVWPNLLRGQSTVESYTISAPTYIDDDDGGGEPEKSGLPQPAVIGIAVGTAALLVGAVLSLYCCFCRAPTGECSSPHFRCLLRVSLTLSTLILHRCIRRVRRTTGAAYGRSYSPRCQPNRGRARALLRRHRWRARSPKRWDRQRGG